MRALLAALLLLGWCSCAEAAIALVDSAHGATTSSVTSISTTSNTQNVAAGDLLVVFCVDSSSSTGISGVSDTAGNTFLPIVSASADSTHVIEAFYAKNTLANSADVVTCNFSVAATYVAVNSLHYSGADLYAPLDASASGGSATAATSGVTGTFSTVVGSEVIAAGASWEAAPTFTAGSGYTLVSVDTDSICAAEDQLLSSMASGETASISSSVSAAWMLVAASFRAAGQHPLSSAGTGQ